MIFRAIIAALLAFFCFHSASAAKKEELSIALSGEFDTLNPVVNSMMVAIYVLDASLRPLVALTPEGKPKALLIKDIPSLKNKKAQFIKKENVPGLKAEIEILPAAVWGDGVPVTCEDVKLTWEIGKHPNVSTLERQMYENIEDIQVDAKNAKKCAIFFKVAEPNFYLNMPRPMPAHLERKIFEEHKEKAHGYDRNSLYVRQAANPGLYNGPYTVSELKLGSHVVLTANPRFFGQTPQIKKLIFKFIMNTATMEANLRSGNVDMTSSSGMSLDQVLAFEKKIKADNLPYEVRMAPGAVYTHIDFNLDHPILQEKNVRQALAYATDRQEMMKAFFADRYKVALHFATEMDSWFTDDPNLIQVYKLDRAKAAQLLDQAGWIVGKEGYRYKGGKKLSFTLNGIADNKIGEMIQVYLQSAWKAVGVELLIKNFPARVFFAEKMRQRNFEMGMYAWVNSPDSSQRSMLHSSMIPTATNSWSGSNRPGWKNKQVDEWLDQAEHEFDLNKRKALVRKIMKAYTEELPALPLNYKSNNSVVPVGLKNYNMSGHVFSEYLAAEEWAF